jgi:hypothetical protein
MRSLIPLILPMPLRASSGIPEEIRWHEGPRERHEGHEEHEQNEGFGPGNPSGNLMPVPEEFGNDARKLRGGRMAQDGMGGG